MIARSRLVQPSQLKVALAALFACVLLALVAGLARPSQASAGTVVYANGTLGAGGAWRNPTTTFSIMTYTRMSIDQNLWARAEFHPSSGGPYSWTAIKFVQNPSAMFISAQARCVNNNGSNNVTGYCAWYY